MGKMAGRHAWRSVLVMAVVISFVGVACGPQPSGKWVGKDCGSISLGPGALLYGCDLTSRDLTNLDLTGADLRGAVLVNADLSGSNLSGADLTGANLTGANLTGANLTGAVLAGAILIGALFIGATLSGASFDFGAVYGKNGKGGGNKSGTSCVGDYCPGYNEATVDNGHPLCNADVGSSFGDWFYVHRTKAQLEAAGARSVVLDGSTSFKGAIFDYSNQELPAIMSMRGISWSTADFSDATFVNAGFGCQQGVGARFSGASFTSTGVAEDAAHWYATDFKDSDFSNSTWTGVVMSTIDFSGSDFSGSTIINWAMENQTDFDSDGSPDGGYVSPFYLMRLDDTDWTDARIGMDVNPGTGDSQVGLAGAFTDMPFTSVSMKGADLSNADIGDIDVRMADLSDVTTTNTRMHGPAFLNGANLTGGWADANWVREPEWYGFWGATCPDGTTYDENSPCLP